VEPGALSAAQAAAAATAGGILMNVYQRLSLAREKFHALKLTKTGRNTFAGYNYFELGDFLIPALAVFREVGLIGYVYFCTDYAYMIIRNVEKPEEHISISSPMGSAALKGCHEVQNIGAVETYQRRYLWVAALEIVEHDALDATTGKEPPAKDGIHAPARLAFESLQPEQQDRMRRLSQSVLKAHGPSQMIDVIDAADLDQDEKAGLWSLLDSKTRSAIKQAQKEAA
jgi:hypothetical protein